ncbi:MAG: adenylate/guanylate cyclase domain-containing protein [Pseudomonadota bacterium]
MRANSGTVAALVLLLAVAAACGLSSPLDARLLDAQFAVNRQWSPLAAGTDVLVIGIDDAFVDSIEEPLTLSHHYLAALLRKVSAAGATVIALDIVLPDKRFDQLYSTSHPHTDYHRSLLAGLIEAQQRSKLVVAKAWDHERHRYAAPQLDVAAVLGEPSMASALVCADSDLRVRRYPDARCQPDGTPHTFAAAIAAATRRQGNWTGLINYQIGAAFDYLPVQQVLAMEEATLRRLFAGRVVLVGSVQSDVDLINVPVPLAHWLPQERHVPGVLAHAQMVRSLLNQGLVATLPAWLALALPLFGGLFWLRPAIGAKLMVLLATSALLLAASAVLLRQGLWIAPAAALLTSWTAALGRSAWQGYLHFRDKQRLSRTFSGYVSPAVLRQILSGAITANDRGSTLPVCVMFSDIRGFTKLSESLPAEQVVALLNRYFARMTAVVHRHGGTVDKFIGDGMMAFFGAPNQLAKPEQAAFDAARDMLAELDVLNRSLAQEGQATLRIGVGIHSGVAVIGHIGSAERHAYTAIGDTVNIAARLEGLCAKLDFPLICSDVVAASLGSPSGLQALGEHALKGHSDVPVHGWCPPLRSDAV